MVRFWCDSQWETEPQQPTYRIKLLFNFFFGGGVNILGKTDYFKRDFRENMTFSRKLDLPQLAMKLRALEFLTRFWGELVYNPITIIILSLWTLPIIKTGFNLMCSSFFTCGMLEIQFDRLVIIHLSEKDVFRVVFNSVPMRVSQEALQMGGDNSTGRSLKGPVWLPTPMLLHRK